MQLVVGWKRPRGSRAKSTVPKAGSREEHVTSMKKFNFAADK